MKQLINSNEDEQGKVNKINIRTSVVEREREKKASEKKERRRT